MSETYTILVLPDIHFPDQDQQALDIALRWAKRNKPNAVVQLGDIVDQSGISRFAKEYPEQLCGDLQDEWLQARGCLDQFRRETRDRFFVLEGNHESRLGDFVGRNPALRNVLDLRSQLGLRKDEYVASDSKGHVLRCEWARPGSLVWRVYKPEDHYELRNGVGFIHGWKFGINHTKATADELPWQGLTVYGHVHTFQYFTATRWGKINTAAASLGWLGKHADYIDGRATRWETGFGVIRMNPNVVGQYNLNMCRIYNGKMIDSDGKVY